MAVVLVALLVVVVVVVALVVVVEVVAVIIKSGWFARAGGCETRIVCKSIWTCYGVCAYAKSLEVLRVCFTLVVWIIQKAYGHTHHMRCTRHIMPNYILLSTDWYFSRKKACNLFLQTRCQ